MDKRKMLHFIAHPVGAVNNSLCSIKKHHL